MAFGADSEWKAVRGLVMSTDCNRAPGGKQRGMDRVGAFFREKTPRRALALCSFVALLVLFRSLLILIVFFVAFERGLGVSSEAIARRFKWSSERALLLVLPVLFVVAGLLGLWGASSVRGSIIEARTTWPQRLEQLRTHPRVVELEEHLPDSDKVLESASHYAADAVKVLSVLGHIALYALIGLILAIVFRLERNEIAKWRDTLQPGQLVGTLVRWFVYVAEAASVTVQLQLVVAACNTLFTPA